MAHHLDEIITMLIETTSDATSPGSQPNTGRHNTHIPTVHRLFLSYPVLIGFCKLTLEFFTQSDFSLLDKREVLKEIHLHIYTCFGWCRANKLFKMVTVKKSVCI